MPIRIKIRILFLLILLLTTVFLLWQAVAPSGKITYVWKPGQDSFFIGKLTPSERVISPADGQQTIIGNPAYFALRTLRPFDQAELSIVFKNNTMPIMEAGVLADKKLWNYDLQPLENTMLDNLEKKWQAVSAGATRLYQKNKNYETVGDFLKRLPATDKIATYNHNLKTRFILKDYTAAADKKTIGDSLRGAYQFFTYIKDEKLDFEFVVSDINKNRDHDPIDINLYYEGKLLLTKHLDDDGIVDDNGKIKNDRVITLISNGLLEGAYKVEVRCNDDVITKKIISTQTKLSFINKIWLLEIGDDVIFTGSDSINAQTINPGSLQTISVGANKLIIDKTFKQFSAKTAGGVEKIILKKGDLILSGDGVFSFDQEAFIDPVVAKINENSNLERAGIEYIIADYEKPAESGGWKTATVHINLDGVYREKQKYSFLISVPGLKADDERNDKVEIEEIRVELAGDDIVGLLKKIVRKIINKI